MNCYLNWFAKIIWLSVLVHLSYALVLLFAPDGLGAAIGTENVEFAYVFVANVGMLLGQIFLFAIGTSHNPERYHAHAWLLTLIHAATAAFLGLGMTTLSPVFGYLGAVDGIFALLLGGLLQVGLPQPYRLGGSQLSGDVAQTFGLLDATKTNSYIAWFSKMTWLGMVVNLGFVLPALLMPGFFSEYLVTGIIQSTHVWLRYAGFTLLMASLLYIPAAFNPLRYHAFAWLSAVARLIAAGFWVWQNAFWQFSGPLATFFIADGSLGLVLGLLLQAGLSPQYRLSCTNLTRLWTEWLALVCSLFNTSVKKTVWGLTIAITGIVGYAFWDNMIRAEPDTVYPNPVEQFKHGAIGLGVQSRIPLYLFEVMPELCGNLLPQPKNGWASLGMLFEDGQELPVGFAKRHIGYPSVEPTCSACHTGSYRATLGGKREITLGSPSQQLNLQGFQLFMYSCVAQPDFTPEKVLEKIRAKHTLTPTQALFYQYLIIPFTKQSLQQQALAYAWQKTRPAQGPGRTDTFNPTKFNVFHQPEDHTIGTVDLPAIWNQRARVGLHLHWDGNNSDIHERNYAAAMAVGATPFSVMPDKFKLVTDFVLQLPPSKYPFAIDPAKVERGWGIYQQHCAECHDLGSQKVGTVTPIKQINTDRHRLDSFTAELVAGFHGIQEREFKFDAYSKTDGYSNLPIDGIWIRAPFLHNGSVPNLWALLQAPGQRPKTFYIGYDVYDSAKVGFITEGPDAEKYGFLLDTSLPGNGNGGHDYGTGLSDDQKWDLLEYLKTL